MQVGGRRRALLLFGPFVLGSSGEDAPHRAQLRVTDLKGARPLVESPRSVFVGEADDALGLAQAVTGVAVQQLLHECLHVGTQLASSPQAPLRRAHEKGHLLGREVGPVRLPAFVLRAQVFMITPSR